MPRLSFISDHDLEEVVNSLLVVANEALNKAEKEFNSNVIDPFSALFEMAGFNINQNVWRSNEKTRKAQKTLSNHVGEFHQRILGKVNGWENPGKGAIVDLISHDHKIIAEIKNKHNTVKGSDLTHVYTELEELVMPKASRYKDYTAYYVQIIPNKPLRYDTFFTPSDNQHGAKKPENPRIRKIDGFSFYDKVTGVEGALKQLFNVLPDVIQSNKIASSFRDEDISFLTAFFEAAFGGSVN
jgi:hypothetical protein